MFIGEFQHAIDDKGRLIMPVRFRERLGESFVVTKGWLEPCLWILPLDEWNVLAEKLRALPLTNKSAQGLARFFFSGATNCTLDKQGRILLPGHLREYARLLRDVVVTGAPNRAEIWARDAWEQYQAETSDLEQLAEQIADFNL